MAAGTAGVWEPRAWELRVEAHWCAHCAADRPVEIVQLATDPAPVAVCLDCGGGVDLWLAA